MLSVIIKAYIVRCFSCGAVDVLRSRKQPGQVPVVSAVLLPFLSTTASKQNMKGLNFI